MAIPMYTASVPVFRQMLGSLADLVAKAEAHATERKLDPAALLQARLYPDMFPFAKQVQVACEFARSVCARLAGLEVPAAAGEGQGFADLRAEVAHALAFLDTLPESAFDTSDDREIVTRPGTPKEKRFSGRAYLLSYGLPQFFFHVSMSYALLRHNGLEIGKRDYMGQY